MKKRFIRSTLVILFTGFLCISSMTAEPLSEQLTNTAESAASIHFSSTEHEALSSREEPDTLQAEEASLIKIQPENRQAEEALLEAQLDKAALLSIVGGLPGDDELICSNLDILTSLQVKKTRDIIQRFDASGSQVSFIVLDLNTGNYLSLNPDSSFYSASTIKGPYVAALNQFSPEVADEYTESMMENTIQWSSNEDYENLHYLYGNDVMYDMTEYTWVSDSIIDEYNWYPYLTAKELTKLWIGTYVYFFEETNENSEWCRSLYTDSTESFIHSALSGDHTVYTKPG